MATTQNLHLPQFDGSDRIHHDDFNEAFDKIDEAVTAAGNCRIATGSYVGTGSYGANNPCTLTFNSTPKFVVISGAFTIFALTPMQNGPMLDTTGVNQTYGVKLAWRGNQLSWYSTSSADHQCNSLNATYHYMALLG